MIHRLHDIERLVLAVLLPLLLALAPARAQIVVHQGETTPLSVVQVGNDHYEWELYNDGTVNFATVPGNCPAAKARFTGSHIGASVDVQWLETGLYFFKVTARDAIGCAMNLKVGMVKVIPFELEAVIAGVTQTGACFNVSLNGSNSVGNIVKYEWLPVDTGGELTRQSGATTEFLLSPSYSGPLPADFRVKLTVTSDKGSTNSAIITIRVDGKPKAEIYSTGKLEKDGTMIVDATTSIGTGLAYKWSTAEGKIIGADNEPTVNLNGAGNYILTITDKNGCKDQKSFKFPLDITQIIARDDRARTSWAKDITIKVLENDLLPEGFIPGAVRINVQPSRGEARPNADGTVTYIPTERHAGTDQFVYEVCDADNNCDMANVNIDIYDAGVTSPEGFSPNGDGINDVLVFIGLVENYPGSQLYVYTRSGQLVYQSADYKNDWDGTSIVNKMSGLNIVPTGVYYYILKLNGTNRSLKGFVYIGY